MRGTDAVTPTRSGFTRSGHSSGLRMQASGSAPRRRWRSLLPRSRQSAIEGHRRSRGCIGRSPLRLWPEDCRHWTSATLRCHSTRGRARNLGQLRPFDRGRTRRHDNLVVGMTLGDNLVHPVLIVGTVSRDGREGIGDLVDTYKSLSGRVSASSFLAVTANCSKLAGFT